ncbi:MAG: 3'(2'),5'-bisphosphate nucleotidase CysQ [Gammaproteobacteria bacterium]
MSQVDIKHLIGIAQQAGQLVMSIYNQPSFETKIKSDQSPLTQADIESHLFISRSLERLYPSIPVLSEESSEFHDYEIRKDWDYFFLVDPLDGTKEFIHRNGEFTINIALIEKNQPIMGVIHAPALQVTYHAEKGKGAFKIKDHEHLRLEPGSSKTESIRVVVSRSHACVNTNDFLKNLETQGKEVLTTSSGSALKFGLVAEGQADIYPRFSPTMEWDTAAGHILVNEIGKQVKLSDNSGLLAYNKPVLKNPGFVVQ